MLNLNQVSGLQVSKDQQTILNGPMLRLARRIDQLFTHWAGGFSAEEFIYSPLMPIEQLHKIDYFSSFPHTSLFPISLRQTDDNLNQFAQSPISPNGELQLTETTPPRHILTPAACFHAYLFLEDQQLPKAQYFTVKGTCFRRENNNRPLERQNAFTMREVICVGSKSEVQFFLNKLTDQVTSFIEHWSFPVKKEHATDSFFNPSKNPRFIIQKVAPLKQEMIYNERLAIGSVNFHQNTFGLAFNIEQDGNPAYSGCVAFGLERWVLFFLEHFGVNESNWPTLDELTG